VYDLRDNARGMYHRIGKRDQTDAGAALSECTGCGECAKKCPQKIEIPARLEQVRGIFG